LSEDEIRLAWKEQPMLRPRIEKVVVNMGIGKSGEPLEKAIKVLKEITGHTPCRRKAKTSIRDFGIRKGESIACIVTLREEEALDFLKKVLTVVDNRVSGRSFDKQGNFSFGLKEHVGIFGMDICVSVTRPGYRVKNRRKEKAKIGTDHILTREESMIFIKDTLGAEII
jgi:large subunit ribosomal protein L5